MDEDREHARSELQPVQLIVDGSIVKLAFVNSWGELGVSWITRLRDNDRVLYLTTGSDLIELGLRARASIKEFRIPNLKDVHEMTLIGDLLWLANTGYDEAVAFDVPEKQVVQRIRLERFRLNTTTNQ